ncbi:MAG: transposase family protein [Pseudolabrys sp.]|nr:transposase family protein [Pseudolabrys sp.]
MAEGHRATRRLVDWVRHEAAKRSFSAIAGGCCLSQRTVLAIWGSGDLGPSDERPMPVVGLAIIPLAGLARPVVIDVDNSAVVEVYRSIDSLAKRLRAPWQGVERVVLDVGFVPMMPLIEAAFGSAEQLADTDSAAREGAAMMLAACREALAASAAGEDLALQTLSKLFNKAESELGRLGRRRLLHPGGRLAQTYRV